MVLAALQTGCALHLKPSDSPLQVPVRYWLLLHVVKEHVAHTPLRAVEAPLRNWLSLHTGCLAQVPLEVADCPVRKAPLGHSTCAPQVKPLVVPPHLPERYCPVLHLTFVQVVQLPFFVADEPARY